MSDPTITRRQFYQALARLLTRRAQAPRPAEYAGLRPAAPSAPPVRPARA